MKVLIVSVGKMYGGVERYTLILGKMLSESGIEVHYALRQGTWLDKQLVDVKKINISLGRNSILDMFRLKNYVEQQRINIVHCNSNNSLFISQLIHENPDCKKIGVIHGDVNVDQRHKGKLICSLYEKLETWLLNRKCTRCIAVSESIKNILTGRGVSEGKIDVIYTGIVPMKYEQEPDFFADELRICTVGNLLPVKNQIVLLKALAFVNKKYPQIKYICDIYGDGAERKNLEEFICKNELNNVSLMGFDTEVRNKLNEYQIYIHTSKYESFGISIIEAMYAGCYVIASNVGGIKEIIDDNCGIAVEVDDYESIADEIYHCYMDRKQLKNTAMNGKNRCSKVFLCTSMIEQILNVYKKISHEC